LKLNKTVVFSSKNSDFLASVIKKIPPEKYS